MATLTTSVARAPAVQVWTDRGDEKGVRIGAAAPTAHPERRYLEFAGGECILEGKSPGAVVELYGLLKKLGALPYLNVKLADGKIHFLHTRVELESLMWRFPDLKPYFWSFYHDCSVFFQDTDDQPRSEMELFENPTAKAKLTRSLVEQADRHFQSKPAPSPVEFTFKAEATDKENLTAAYQKFQGMCVGEVHHCASSKQFLIDNMETLCALGVKTLFLEDFFYDTQQPLLDHYFETPGADIPPLVLLKLDQFDTQWGFQEPYRFRDILRKAKSLGIRIVGIDTGVAYEASPHRKDEPMKRLRAMNFVAETIINREKGDGKYLAFMGISHAATMLRYHQDDSSRVQFANPGMADLLQCPLVAVYDSYMSKDKPSRVNIGDVKDSRGDVLKHVHLLLERTTRRPPPPARGALTQASKV